jgi:hypothetical protein
MFAMPRTRLLVAFLPAALLSVSCGGSAGGGGSIDCGDCDPRFWRCSGTGADRRCADIDECRETSLVCGDPNYFSCTNLAGAPPLCGVSAACPGMHWGETCTDGSQCCSGYCGASGHCESATGQFIVIEEQASGGNAVPLDDSHVAVAYTIADRATNATEFYVVIVEITESGHTVGTPLTVTQDLIAAGQSHNFEFMAPIGPNHFVLVTVDPTWGRTMHFFRRDDMTVAELHATPTTHAYYGGHPIDDTRYLLRYRETSWSDSQVKFQVLVRSGDTLSEAASLNQLPPSSFPEWNSSSEPQTSSALLRMGPSTFKEIRGGYVYQPGYLAAATLTLNDDNTLSFSDPLVFTSSSTKTTEPVVVGNGVGDGIVAFASYGNGWKYGSLRTAATVYTEGGALSDRPSYFRNGGEDSTWGYFDGRYYFRGVWGTLYRFDRLDQPPVEMPLDLYAGNCPDTAPVMRVGKLGVFLVCGRPLHLRVMTL